MNKIEQNYDALIEDEFYTPEVSVGGITGAEPEALPVDVPPKPMADVAPGQPVIQEIPRNPLEEAVGMMGKFLTSVGVPLDQVGIDFPGLGRITLKDITVGESGKIIEDLSYGFTPTEGGGLQTRLKPEVLDIPIAGAVTAGAKMAAPAVMRAVKDMPAGLSVKPVTEAEATQMMAAKGVQQPAKQQAPKSGLGFYSAVEDAALNLQRNSGAGQAFLNDIKKGANVKDEEIKWIGLDEFLAGKKNVTKQEVQDYIANNRVDVQEVALGGRQPFDSERLDELLSEYNSLKQHPIDDPSFGQEKYDELIRLMNIRDQSTTDTLYQQAEEFERMAQRAQGRGNTLVAEKYFREAEFFNTRAEKLDLEGQGMDSPPKFGQYTLPGGENYREILLTMPSQNPVAGISPVQAARVIFNKEYGELTEAQQREVKRRIADEKNPTPYMSKHWQQPNVLAHIRVNDRVDADGKKMLLIEEVQSDWHQAGRDKGYKTNAPAELPQGTKVFAPGAPDSPGQTNMAYTVQIPQSINGRSLFYGTTEEEAMANARSFIAQPSQSAVPDAPFKDTWYQLALKRALQYAAENGYDRVGLTTGARQAERYDLSKQISRVVYNPETEMLNAFDKSNVSVIQRSNVKPNEVQDYIGKEPAQRLFDEQNAKTDRRGGKDVTYQEISGEDLQVGGEGMKKYYDEVYPKFLQKYGKKWDAKMGNTTIEADGAEPVRYIDITPKMKQSVSESGQPLFTAAPIATGAGSATIAQDGETDGN